MFNGTGLSNTSYVDNIVSNGVEYCYQIASVYDDEVISEKTSFSLWFTNIKHSL